MFSPFQPIERLQAEVHTRLPAAFRRAAPSGWADANRRGAALQCFLEGPSFDRDGNRWLVDIPFGRVFCITPAGEWTLALAYDGWPNGLKLHRDGRVFIADHRLGLVVLDPATGRHEVQASRIPSLSLTDLVSAYDAVRLDGSELRPLARAHLRDALRALAVRLAGFSPSTHGHSSGIKLARFHSSYLNERKAA